MSDYTKKRTGGPPERTVGVRDLKTHAASIVRMVRETRASYVITHRGNTVGMILPVDPADPLGTSAHHRDDDDGAAAWGAFERAGRRVGQKFRADASGVQLLSESRR